MGRLLNNTEPIYKKHCNRCIFLGTYEYLDLRGNTRQTDLYFCGNPDAPETSIFEKTIVGQYSDIPGDDTSGIVFGQSQHEDGIDAPLAEAYRIAVQREYIRNKVDTSNVRHVR